jgi:zinc/manganese transport system permease protein
MISSSVLHIMLPAFCECLVLVGIHSYLGLHVIKRKVIFVDLAFAQIAALGTLIAFLFGIPPHTGASFGFAIALTGLGAAIFSLCRFRRSRVPQEAIIGLVYAIAAALAILLIDKAPHGAEHLKEIMTGSILWVRWPSILTAAVVYTGVGLFHYLFRDRFLLISEDPEAAWDRGLRVRLWDFLFYLSFGIVITVSVDVAGVLIVFVFLVAPAIIGIMLTDRLRTQLLLGWALGVVVTTAGIALAYVKDLSTGPAVIATYGVTMIIIAAVSYVVRAPRRELALRNAALVGLAFIVALGAMAAAGSRLGGGQGHGDDTPAAQLDPAPRDLVAVGGVTEQLAIVNAALDREAVRGAALALEFLRGDPPPFFREQIVERLTEVMGRDPGFVADEGIDSPVNQRAMDEVAGFIDRSD